MTTSKPRFCASASAPVARRTGSISPAGSCTRTPACFADAPYSCSIAAGRRTSVETSIGCRPCFASHRASLADVVVLPDPCRPSIRTTRGRACDGGKPPGAVAEQRQHLVAHDAHDLLRRRQALEDVLIDGLVADAIDERLDDLEVDVRFEQRQADFAQRRLDGLLGQTGFTAKRPEDVLEAGAERFEHDCVDAPRTS